MRQFSHIWLITEPIKCGITGCVQEAKWLTSKYIRSDLICDDHKALYITECIMTNEEFSELPPCRIDISYGNEEIEPNP